MCHECSEHSMVSTRHALHWEGSQHRALGAPKLSCAGMVPAGITGARKL